MAAAHEQFPPDDLLAQAVAAERAGFDGLSCSDHFQPLWEPGESGHAWTWLGAAGALTDRVALGTPGSPPRCTATTPLWWPGSSRPWSA